MPMLQLVERLLRIARAQPSVAVWLHPGSDLTQVTDSRLWRRFEGVDLSQAAAPHDPHCPRPSPQIRPLAAADEEQGQNVKCAADRSDCCAQLSRVNCVQRPTLLQVH